MSEIQLMPSSIKYVPLDTYAKNFTFIVNGQKFETSQIISDLLSPTISKLHSQDPILDTFIINTRKGGDFSQILKLGMFEQITFSQENYEFFVEVLEKLGNESILIKEPNKEDITNANVLSLVTKHEQFDKFFFKRLEQEIDYISSHFFELCETKQESLKQLHIDTLLRIINNDKLRLKSEDQLIEFINRLYVNNSQYSILYECVNFAHVSVDKVHQFINIYDYNNMTNTTWKRIATRLGQEIKVQKENDRYYKQTTGIIEKIIPIGNNSLNGIINYLKNKSNNNVFNEIDITASSCGDSGEKYRPKIVVQYDNQDTYFYSSDIPNSWLCIDFIKHRVMLTDYTIRSYCYDSNCHHLKNWKIEGSNDNSTWVTLDEQINCSHLNGNKSIYSFHINEQESTRQQFRYIRIQQTGENWNGHDYLLFNSIEFFGTLISPL